MLKIFKNKIFLLGVVILIFGYFIYRNFLSNKNQNLYTLIQVGRGDITIVTSGTGYVIADKEIDIKSEVSGNVDFVGFKEGDFVKKNNLIVKLDDREAQKLVRNAEINLESAKLSLEKLKQPVDTYTLVQAENALLAAQQVKQKAEDELKKSYEDGVNIITNVFLDVNYIINGLKDIFFKNNIAPNFYLYNITWYANQTLDRERAAQYANEIIKGYNLAFSIYLDNFKNYEELSRFSDFQTIENLILKTYEMVKVVADVVKTSKNFVDFVVNYMKDKDLEIPSLVLNHQINLESFTLKINNNLSSLLNIKTAIQTNKDNVISAERSVIEKSEYLQKLKKGPDELDLKSAELLVKQRENELMDAREKINDYYIRAPFDGVITKINVKSGDSIESGKVVATLSTNKKIAEIVLNEVDVTKVNINDEAFLTFDALPEVRLKGKVVSINPAGEISQGVVSYKIKIAFENNPQVKIGMTVNAEIINEKKENVLVVPNQAVKKFQDKIFVEVPDERDLNILNKKIYNLENFGINSNKRIISLNLNYQPKMKFIKTGLSDEKNIEVLEGLKEGEWVIIKSSIINQKSSNNEEQGFFQRFFPQPRRFIRSPGIKQ